MAMMMGDPTSKLAFSMYENKGVYAVLLGSGVSRSAGIPTGWEITLELVKRYGIAHGVQEKDDWHGWYVGETGEEPNYSSLLEGLAGTQTERRAIIQGFLEPSEQELEDDLKTPTRAHRAIAAMVKAGHVRVIITTNFDRLMENALRDVGVEPTVVSSVDTLAGAEPLIHSRCYIVKLHGDYKDARILNTDAELGKYDPAFDALLGRIFDEFGLIVAGWSGGWDQALRDALFRDPARRYPTYWLARSRPSEHGLALVNHRRATIVGGMDADAFFEGLNLKLETIERSRQPNPLGIELTVAMAKRFMAKAEHRIQLDDLVTAHVHQAIERIAPIIESGDAFRTRSFTDWVTEYESAVEPLARLCAALGRWGADKEHTLVVEAIQALHAESLKVQTGQANWLQLQSYPAALIMYSYGLGLTRAGRLSALHKLLDATLVTKSGRPSSMGAELPPFSFEEDLEPQWREFEGQSDAITPLSDRIATVVTPRWAPSFAGVQDPLLIYERFEFLSLIFFVKKRGATLEVLNNWISQKRFKTCVKGRLSWDSKAAKRFVQEYILTERQKSLIEAGFVNQDSVYLKRFIEGLQQFAFQ